MAASCCGGSVRVLPRLDPDACNAMRQTAGGLLVPRAVLEGIAPGSAVGDARSVDIDVQAPAAGACPETWTIGARLTPVHGEAFLTTAVNLVTPATNAYVDTGLSVLLPEAGVYEVAATVRTAISITAAGVPYNIAIWVRLFNVTAGAAVPNTTSNVHAIGGSNPSGSVSEVSVGDVRTFITVTAPTTIRLEAARNTGSGTAVNNTGVYNPTRLGFVKVSD